VSDHSAQCHGCLWAIRDDDPARTPTGCDPFSSSDGSPDLRLAVAHLLWHASTVAACVLFQAPRQARHDAPRP